MLMTSRLLPKSTNPLTLHLFLQDCTASSGDPWMFTQHSKRCILLQHILVSNSILPILFCFREISHDTTPQPMLREAVSASRQQTTAHWCEVFGCENGEKSWVHLTRKYQQIEFPMTRHHNQCFVKLSQLTDNKQQPTNDHNTHSKLTMLIVRPQCEPYT